MTAFGEVLTGRLAPHPELTHPRVKLGDYLKDGYTNDVPDTVDWMGGVEAWPMYANDRIRDCVAAAAGHAEESWSRYGAGKTLMVTDDDVIRFYEQISGYNPTDPSTDKGANMQDGLDVWRKVGVAGHRIVGFAQLDHTNQPECKAALAWFGVLYVGVNLPASAVAQTRARVAWSCDPSLDNRIAGRHAVHIGACDASGLWKGSTWGRSQEITSSWLSNYAEEAWVPLSREWIKQDGVSASNLKAQELNARFTELTGEPGPFPVPDVTTPPPVPVPTPPATDPNARLVTQCWPWAVGHHIPGTGAAKAATALVEWRKQVGL